MRKAACLLLLLVFLTGCTMLVREPVVAVKDLNLVSMDSAGAAMELYLTVQNTNAFDISLMGYSYDLKVMALPLAQGGARDEIRFAAGAATDLRIPIRVSYRDLLEILKRQPDPDHIPYQLSAGLDLDTPMGQLNVPVKRNGSYAIPKQYRPATLIEGLSNFFRTGR